jgi:tetratricopeptide (TPR) repeat protein
MKVAGEDVNALISMGSMFLEAGDLDYATHCLLWAVDIDSANADAYYYLGVASAIKGSFKDAAEFFTHALDIKSEHVLALRDSAFVYLAMGKIDEATERIEKVYSLANDNGQIRLLRRRTHQARIREKIKVFLHRLNPRVVFKKASR